MYSTQAQPSAFSSLNEQTRQSSETFSSSRTFSENLLTIWDQVDKAKQKGIVKNDDDQFWIAYRSAEDLLRQACERICQGEQQLSKTYEENARLKQKLAMLEKTSV